MIRSLSPRQSLVLTVVVLLGVTLTVAGALLVAGRQRPWASTFETTVRFADIKGVGPGTPVRLFGYPAGEVLAAELPTADSGERAVTLRLRLLDEVRPLLRADTTARIRGEGLIGTRVIDLDPGEGEPFDPAQSLTAADTPDLDELMRRTAITMNQTEQLVRELRTGQEKLTADASAALREAQQLVAEVRAGQGTIGKLARDPQAYDQLLAVLREGQDTLSAVRRDAEAARQLPLLGSYVAPSATEVLVRPNADRFRKVFAESDLFTTGQATLTDAGKAKLDAVAEWLKSQPTAGSEIVVVAYAAADNADSGSVANRVTEAQANEAVAYLRDIHAVHKLGWWSRRKISGLGLGRAQPPQPESETLPPARIEVVLYVPRSR
jgi:phospholipid/cholesterol/gamma-HCH transport system substrate-binding protein